MEKLNIGRDLTRVAELLKEHGPIDTIGAPNLSGEFEELVGRLAKELFVEMELSVVDVLIVARIYTSLPKSRYCTIADIPTVTLLRDVFGYNIPIMEQLTVVTSLLERDLLTCGSVYLELIREDRIVTSVVNPTRLLEASVELTTYARANIIRDNNHMYKTAPPGFASNLEFLESWKPIINEVMEHSELNIDNIPYFFEPSLEGLRIIQVEFDHIMKRLESTKIEIPFKKFADAFKLNREEQILVMYEVFHYRREKYLDDLNHSVAFAPFDTPAFLDRPVLTQASHLVKEGIFKQTLVESDGKEQPKYRLEGIFYGHILGDFVLRAHEPLV